MEYHTKVLLLDDNENRYNSLKALVPKLTWVENTRDFQKVLQSQQFDILMLDHDLGLDDSGMNAITYIRQLKPDVKQMIVHSSNIIAGPKMVKYLKDMGYNSEYIDFCTLIHILRDQSNDFEYIDCKIMWE